VKKKKNFLLLEILIAILIVSICLVPLVQNPIRSYRAEMRLLEEMERERLADWTFSEIKEKLLKNEIAWEKLPGLAAVSGPFPLPQAVIQIPGCASKQIVRSYMLQCGEKGEKEGLKGEIYRMLRVNIEFAPRLSRKTKYTYRIMVRKIPRHEKETGGTH
jgi:hypothetical protein